MNVITLSPEDVIVSITNKYPRWKTASDGDIMIAIDIDLTPALILEGRRNDLIRIIQDIRKINRLELKDRINITIDDKYEDVLEEYDDYIRQECLIDLIKTNNLGEIKILEKTN